MTRFVRPLAYFTFLAAFAAGYAVTLQSGAQAADSGELQLVALTFGIAHPPGYPLWSIVAGLFARIPGLDPLAGISLFSLITALATLAVVASTVEVLVARGRPPVLAATLAGISAAALLGVSGTFWTQATTANIRSLTSLFAALLGWAAAHACLGRRTWPVAAVIVGLSLAHHPSLAFPALPLTACVLLRDMRGVGGLRRLAVFTLLVASTQIVWFYLPLRDVAEAAFAPGSLRTAAGLLDHVLARGFGGDMFWFVLVEPERLADRLALLPMLSAFVFTALVACAGAVGIIIGFWRRPSFAVAAFAAIALHLFVTLTYRAPQTVEYALPAWVLATMLAGVGFGALTDFALLARWATAVPLLLCATAAYFAAVRLPELVLVGADHTARDRAAAALDAAPAGAVMLSQWHQATPLWVVQNVERRRADVRVEYVAPNGAQQYADTFAERARDRLSQPVVVTSNFAAAFARSLLRAVPMKSAPAWRIEYSGDPITIPETLGVFDQHIQISASLHSAGAVMPGDLVDVDVFWNTLARSNAGEALTVRIFRIDGRLAANADIQIDASSASGARRVQLGIPLDLPAGDYSIMLGAYRAKDGNVKQLAFDNREHYMLVSLLHVEPVNRPPASGRFSEPAMLLQRIDASHPRVVGVDYDLGVPERVRLWVHFALGMTGARVAVVLPDGAAIGGDCSLPAAAGRFASCAFDVPPRRDLRLSGLGDAPMSLPGYLDGERYVSFGGRMILRGLQTCVRGSERIVDLTWLSARSLVDDYVVSVRVDDRAHDGVPALGALPTLKWFRGSIVDDRHPVVRSGASETGGVVVYDSAAGVDLPLLDERYDGRFTFGVP